MTSDEMLTPDDSEAAKPDILTERFTCLHCGHDQPRIVSGFSWYIAWECGRCRCSTWRYWLNGPLTTTIPPWRMLELEQKG